MIKTGLVSISFRKFTVKDIVSAVAKAGLSGIEWGGDVHVPHGDLIRAKEVAAQTKDYGLEIPCYGSYYRAGWRDPANPSVQAVVDTAAELGAPLIRIWAGRQGSSETSPSSRQTIIDAINTCVTAAKKARIKVALEYHANTLTDTFQSTVELLASIEDPYLQTLWQPPLGSEPAQNLKHIQSLLPRLANLHVFHWTLDSNGVRQKQPLATGKADWIQYIAAARPNVGTRYALLEFVKDDSLDQFYQDATTLRNLLQIERVTR